MRMISDPLISIVLPSYNGARYVCESIDSCLRQSYHNWELIIVDDASTDDTPSIIAEYVARDHRIRSIRNAVNRRLPGSLNTGFADASGQFLTWTSDDNCYRPEALNEMLQVLKVNPGVDVVYADFTVIDENGSPIGPSWTGPLEKLPFSNVVGACFLYRRTVQEQLGGYAEDLVLVEDYDFWLRASAQFQLKRLEKDLYLYRWHENSLTQTRSLKVQLAHEKCLVKNLPGMTWMDSSLQARAYQNLVYQAMERDDRRAAWSHIWSWMRIDPLMMRRDLLTVAYSLIPPRLHHLIKWAEPWDWLHKLRLSVQEIAALIPPGLTLILVDEAKWDGSWYDSEVRAARRVLPFLERDGQYFGSPSDDETAIREFERLRHSGANFIVFAWPAFWWLDSYKGFSSYLRSQFPCVVENDRLVVFDLRS